MPTPAEGASGRRRALIVATASYGDPTLAQLRAPGQDASDFAAVLQDAAVGGFEVETVLDAHADALRRQVARFCSQGGPHDLALVYLSCHGVLDDRGRLYYATVDTDRTLLSATALPATWLNEQLEDCRCRRQILVLDCCHSGAFAKGAKGDGGLALGERFEGRGRVVLTGSRATEYSFERDRVVGDGGGAASVFTSTLVQGLRSGDADRDRDGLVTVGELYDYAYEVVRSTSGAQQTPTLWTYGAEGDLLVAHSPRGAHVEPAPLPEELIVLLESARPRVRESAVAELADLLGGPDAGRALTARAQLERVAAQDVPSVAAAARAALAAASAVAPAPPDSPPPQRTAPFPSRPAATAGPRARKAPTIRELAATTGATAGKRRRRRPGPAAAGASVVVAVAALVVVLLAGGGDGLPSPGPDGTRVSGSPRGVAYSEGSLWVARHDDGKVDRIDLASSRTKEIDVGAAPDQIAVDEGEVWVTVDDGAKLMRIDPQANRADPPVDVDVGDCNCAITKLVIAEGELWTSSESARTITARNLRNGKRTDGPYGLQSGFEGRFAVGGGFVWAVGTDSADTSWLTRINPASGEIKETFYSEDRSFFSGIAYGPGSLWIADAGRDKNRVTVIDSRNGKRHQSVVVRSGISSDDIAVIPGAVLVWDPDNGLLTNIDAGTPSPVSTLRVRDYPRGKTVNRNASELAADGHFAWITDPAGDALYKVRY